MPLAVAQAEFGDRLLGGALDPAAEPPDPVDDPLDLAVELELGGKTVEEPVDVVELIHARESR